MLRIFVQLIGALIVVQPWSREKCTKELAPAKEMALGPDTCNPTHLCWSSAAIFFCGLVAFWVMQWAGEKTHPEKHGDGEGSGGAREAQIGGGRRGRRLVGFVVRKLSTSSKSTPPSRRSYQRRPRVERRRAAAKATHRSTSRSPARARRCKSSPSSQCPPQRSP